MHMRIYPCLFIIQYPWSCMRMQLWYHQVAGMQVRITNNNLDFAHDDAHWAQDPQD